MIPELRGDGLLPEGEHGCSWHEVVERYGGNPRRRSLLNGLRRLLDELRRCGCIVVWLDGSFVSDKQFPNDYDLCWELDSVKIEDLDPVLLEFSERGKRAMLKKYGGDIRPASASPREAVSVYREFFQLDRDGKRKGILKFAP